MAGSPRCSSSRRHGRICRAPIAGYAARAIRPLFVGERVTFNGRLTGDTAALWASGPDGGLNYRVDVTLAAPAS